MSRKTFGGCGFAPDPGWGAHIALTFLLFKGKGREEKAGRGGREKGKGNSTRRKFHKSSTVTHF